jgi:hypothetical protein
VRRESIATVCFQILLCLLPGLVDLCNAQTQPEQQPSTKTEEESRKPASEKEDVRKIFEIKYQNVDQLADVLRIFGIPIRPNIILRVISVMGPREVVGAVEEAIKRLDVPLPTVKNIELTAYLLVASLEQGGSKSTPSELEAVVKQLRGTFSYQGFRLLDTLVVRFRDGASAAVNGVAPKASEHDRPSIYKFSFTQASLASDGTSRTVRINQLRLGAEVPVKIGPGPDSFSTIESVITTNVDVREGQKVVVGKATIDGSNNALFLVLTAKVLD